MHAVVARLSLPRARPLLFAQARTKAKGSPALSTPMQRLSPYRISTDSSDQYTHSGPKTEMRDDVYMSMLELRRELTLDLPWEKAARA